MKHALIIIFTAIAVFSFNSGNCQTDSLLVDETNISVTPYSYKVQTDNYFIPGELIKNYGDKCKYYTMRNRKDRNGSYQEYTFYFDIKMRPEVELFIINLKRPK